MFIRINVMKRASHDLPSRRSISACAERRPLSMAMAVLVATSILLPVPPVRAAVVVRTVALDGQPAPGTTPGVVFESLNNAVPTLNNAGQTAFHGVLGGSGVNTDNDRGIWSEATGSLALVAREGQHAAGAAPGVEFKSLTDPQLSDDGATTFFAFLRGTAVVNNVNHTGIWSGGSDNLRLVVRQGSQARLEVGTKFGVFNTPSVGHFGRTAFFTLLSDTGVDDTNYRSLWSEGLGSLTLIAQMGSPALGTEPETVFQNFTRPVTSGAGQTGFRATLSGPGVEPANSLSFWSGNSKTLRLVAREGSPAPGTGEGVVFDNFNDGGPTINDRDQLAFVAGLAGDGVDDSNDRGIWSEGDGGLSLVAREGAAAPSTDDGVIFSDVLVDEIPGIPGDPFAVAGFTSHVINSAGAVAFVAGLDGPGVNNANQLGIWSNATGSLELVARMGDAAPGTAPDVRFASFGFWSQGSVSLNGKGDVAFLGILTGPTVSNENNLGIWMQSDGLLTKVIRTGDTLEVAPEDVRLVAGLNFVSGSGGQDGLPRGLNDSGQIAFGAQFADGSSGVFVASLGNSAIVPTIQDRYVDGFVISPHCQVEDFDNDEAVGFGLFDGEVAANADCALAGTAALASQTSLVETSFMMAEGASYSEAHAGVPDIAHAIAGSFFEVTFELPSQSAFLIQGIIRANNALDQTVGAYTDVRLMSQGNETVVAHTLNGAPDEPESEQITSAGTLDAGTYTFRAQAATVIDNDVPPGRIAEASFVLTFEVANGDIDGDADVDLDDFRGFQDCLAGPGIGAPEACRSFDFDFDNDVDWADFVTMQLVFTGG